MNRLLSFAILLFLCAGCAHVAGTRADFQRVVARPPVALAPRVESQPDTNGFARFHFSFASDAQNRVPGILLEQKNTSGRRPVVIVLHGTGGSKEGELPWLQRLAARGFIAVAIDGRYHGERKTNKGQEDYHAAIVHAYRGSGEHPFFYDTVFDVTRLVDYLATRDDVDARRIGLIGISKGGIETYLAAAVEPRIAVAVPCIGMQSFSWALKNNDWQGRIGTIQNAFNTIATNENVPQPDAAFVKKFFDRLVPGIDSEFDGPQMIALIAPRPLLVINSDADNHTPLPGVEECVVAAKKSYAAKNADEKFALIIQKNTGHKVLPESERAAADWFVKWLHP